MTECNKCSCHNWDEITLWKCGNSECAELYPNTNGSEWENKASAELLKQLTTTQQALDSAVEALKGGKEAIEIFILEKLAQDDVEAMVELFELTKTNEKKVHELIAERYNKIARVLTNINGE